MGKNKHANEPDINGEDIKRHGWAVETASRLGLLNIARSRHRYDGVLGELPGWFPHFTRSLFILMRDRVLDRPLSDGTRPSPEKAQTWILAMHYAREKVPPDLADKLEFPPDELLLEIHTLETFYRANLLGEEKGLNFLLGKVAARHLKSGKSAAERPKEIQGSGVKGNQERALKFYAAVSDWKTRIAREHPKLKAATRIADQIMQAIEMDTDMIEQAQKRGEPWEALDLKFPVRRNAKGDPCLRRAVVEEIRNPHPSTRACSDLRTTTEA